VDWLKWYLSVPLKALGAAVFRIGAVRARVRQRLDTFDLKSAVFWGTIATSVLWFAVWLAADDGDRNRLTETVRSLLSD